MCYKKGGMANLPLETLKKLYYIQGLTAQEIGKKLGTTPWVVYKFMRRKRLPRRAIQESNRIRFEKTPLSFKIKTNLNAKEEHLRIAGVMLYWAEGSHPKSRHHNWTVEFANSNPSMVKIFLRFLREICGITESRLRLHIYCYADQNLKTLQRFWTKETEIPLTHFTKPFIREDFRIDKSGKMKYGMVHIRYSDKRLLLHIGKWTEEYSKLLGGSYSGNYV